MSQFVEKLEKEREDHKQSIKKLTLAELRVKVSWPFSLTLCYSNRTGSATFLDWGRKKSCWMRSSIPNLGEGRESVTSISWSHPLWNRKCLILGRWLGFSSPLERMKSSITVGLQKSLTLDLRLNLCYRYLETVQLHGPTCRFPTSFWDRRHVITLQGDTCHSETQIWRMGNVSFKVWGRAQRANCSKEAIQNLHSWQYHKQTNVRIQLPHAMGRVPKYNIDKELLNRH